MHLDDGKVGNDPCRRAKPDFPDPAESGWEIYNRKEEDGDGQELPSRQQRHSAVLGETDATNTDVCVIIVGLEGRRSKSNGSSPRHDKEDACKYSRLFLGVPELFVSSDARLKDSPLVDKPLPCQASQNSNRKNAKG